MKAHIFLIANLKFRLQTPCSFGDMAEKVKLIGIPINNFLCIYIIASSPGLHTLFCLWRVNKKLPQGETSRNTFQRSRSISWKCKIHMVKWAHPPLRKLWKYDPCLYQFLLWIRGHRYTRRLILRPISVARPRIDLCTKNPARGKLTLLKAIVCFLNKTDRSAMFGATFYMFYLVTHIELL